jgi:hypothetical protein
VDLGEPLPGDFVFGEWGMVGVGQDAFSAKSITSVGTLRFDCPTICN